MTRRAIAIILFLGIISAVCLVAQQGQSNQGLMMIVFKDGHRQTVRLADVSRIEFASPETPARSAQTGSANVPGRNHFFGKWEVGDGAGSKFLINLKEDGTAEKSMGATHGTWTVTDGEARIVWDDGWRDVIRKVGSKHEKLAYGPGKSFSDKPSNVTDARSTEPKPL